MSMKTRKMVPPDGGWGWLIVFGSSLINVSTVSIEPSFGLLFGGFLKQIGAQTTDASLVLSTMDGLLCFSVLFALISFLTSDEKPYETSLEVEGLTLNVPQKQLTRSQDGIMLGPLLKRFTYRKVAMFGAALSCAAILLTALVQSMPQLLITFGFLGGIGFGLSHNCTYIGINNYFSKRKGQAIGLSMTGTAVGFMLMPQLVRLLLDEYGFRPAIVIIGALSLHALVGAALFQPISWHKKSIWVDLQEDEANSLLSTDKSKRTKSTFKEVTNGVKSNLSHPNPEDRKTSLSITPQTFLGVEPLIHDVSPSNGAENTSRKQGIDVDRTKKELEKIIVDSIGVEEIQTETNEEKKFERTKKKSLKSRLSRFSKFMDLDLLRDGEYLNIIYGLSILSVAEVNFKLILPFFLSDLGFSHSEIASALSSMALSDISSRLIIPPILDRIALTRRTTFILGSIIVAFIRSILALQKSTGLIITTLVILGFFRGISLTSFPLVLTEYSSGSNFPSVLGLCTVIRAVFIAVLVPLCGYIRDSTNSYPLYIHFQFLLMASVVVAWIVEKIILKYRKKKQAKQVDLQTGTEDQQQPKHDGLEAVGSENLKVSQ